jgi:hypothetical protein
MKKPGLHRAEPGSVEVAHKADASERIDLRGLRVRTR